MTTDLETYIISQVQRACRIALSKTVDAPEPVTEDEVRAFLRIHGIDPCEVGSIEVDGDAIIITKRAKARDIEFTVITGKNPDDAA